ncbi:MAG: cell wall metabolism sensor histidine kinase WalK [Defluviitaleaceae bacterium]|nr:cell wall metabolism sensor histidine kinase WalK [Defluviitaleaceae bacterium]MCL2273713.1 cell wall metabolism sensor histidine kinase WalK [Defluviitaleaceae bacterium]
MNLQRFNSIKLKLMVIYISVVLIVMAVSGTFMLRQVRQMEYDLAEENLRALADLVNAFVVQPNPRAQFIDTPAWDMIHTTDDIKVVLMSDLGIGIAPAGFVGWRVNDHSISWAMSGLEGFSVGRVGMDLNDNEVQWLSFAMPVDHPEGRVIINTRMSTEDVNARLNQLTGILLIAVFVVLVLTLVAWFFLADTLARPIIGMARVARGMAAGDLSKKIPVNSGDEIGVLAKNFNYMTDEISRHLEQQKKMDEARKEFVANVSHELRTPLTNIRSYTETLIDGAMEDPVMARKFLEIVDEEAKRMTALVTDLLELSRIDAKRGELELDVVDLLGLVRLTLRQCQVLAEQKNQLLWFNDAKDSCFILANATRISQVITNVLSNAIKYSGERTTIHVMISSDEMHHRVSIRDEGMGIPPEDLTHIFERFYRVDKARSRAMGGTGLGLAIAKEIMEEHGGTITATSTVGEGTTMVLKFKRAENEDETSDAPPEMQRVKYV